MYLVRVLINGVIMLAEVAGVLAVAWLGHFSPFAFAALTAVLGLILGTRLEILRLRNELPFYFQGGTPGRYVLVPLVGFVEAILKAALAGLAALFAFSGTDPNRLFWSAIVFGAVVFAGSTVLRALSQKLNARPLRWGYFRLGVPLGLMFSVGLAVLAGLALLPPASLSDIGWKIVWEIPAKPSLEQVSELVFQVKQVFDEFVVTLLSTFLPRDWARLVGVVVSVNVLAGFVASLYASVIASVVRWAEAHLP